MLRATLLSLVFGSLIDVTIALAVRGTAVRREGPSIVRRDEGVATISLGPLDQYLSFDDYSLPEKRAITIHPTDIPEDKSPVNGFTISLGPELQADVNKVIEEKCKNEGAMDTCIKEISALLGSSDIKTLSKRFGPIAAYTVFEAIKLAIAGLVAVVGVALGSAATNNVKVPTTNYGIIAQANAAGNASAIALATGVENNVVATFAAMRPTPTPISPSEEVQVEQLTQDEGEYKEGDILMKVPQQSGDRLMDYLRVLGLASTKRSCGFFDDPGVTPIVEKRVPPTELKEWCLEQIYSLAERLSTDYDNGMQLIRTSAANNPMNPAQFPGGVFLPNLNFGGENIAVRIARRYLYRQLLGNRIDPNTEQLIYQLQQTIMSLFTVWSAIQNTPRREGENVVFSLSIEWWVTIEVRVLIEQAQKTSCDADLYCVEDNCNGYLRYIYDESDHVSVEGQPDHFYQTGFCIGGENHDCRCSKVDLPYVRVTNENYFEDLETWTQMIFNNEGDGASCDPNNKASLPSTLFGQSINKGCSNHDELKRLKKRDLSPWEWTGIDDQGFQWGLDWNDKSEDCDLGCEDMFEIFQSDENCVWNDGNEMSKAGFVETKCGIASYSVDKPDPPHCYSAIGYLAAPRGRKEVDEEGGSGKSVDEAITEFCNQIDGQRVIESQDNSESTHWKRYGYSAWRVPDRYSFWLKAEYAPRPGCAGYEWPHKTNCKAALRQAMDTCSGSEGRTPGLKVNGIGCIDYSIDISTNTHDDALPGKDHKKEFPPPEDALDSNAGNIFEKCYDWLESNPVTAEDRDLAIESHCSQMDGKEPGADSSFPPPGQAMFWAHDRCMLHENIIKMGTEKAQDKYLMPNWCDGWNGKLSKDDCTYALRKIIHGCSTDKHMLGGELVYRCINYKAFPVNFRKDPKRVDACAHRPRD